MGRFPSSKQQKQLAHLIYNKGYGMNYIYIYIYICIYVVTNIYMLYIIIRLHIF